MSRALDKDAASFLKNGDSAASFTSISTALDPKNYEGLIEIEILKGSHYFEPGTHILQDGNAIAVSKTSLVQAYFVALKLLKRYLAELAERSTTTTPKDEPATLNPDGDDDLLHATYVILLMDPEHLTAANLRKRMIAGYGTTATAESEHCLKRDSGLRNVLQREKRFVDSLLTSRLHRHTKSPTLWSHRRWLIPLYRKHGLLSVLDDISDIVFVAAERHPRNYYAWHHSRMLVALGEAYDRRALLTMVLDWCTRHHDDVSGWSFLAHLLSRPGCPEKDNVEVMGDVHKLTRSIRWSNESVWWFLRSMAAWSTRAGAEEEFHESLRIIGSSVQPGISREGSGQRVLDTAAAWYERNCRTTLQGGMR